MSALKGSGKSNYDILMRETSDEVQELATSHGERLAIVACEASLNKLKESRNAVRNYFVLFGLEVVLRELALFVL